LKLWRRLLYKKNQCLYPFKIWKLKRKYFKKRASLKHNFKSKTHKLRSLNLKSKNKIMLNNQSQRPLLMWALIWMTILVMGQSLRWMFSQKLAIKRAPPLN
jgi:hypothetical protein